jgi:hypothetical protein
MKWEKLVALAQELPEVTVESWYRTPSLKVRGKGFVRLKEDGETVVFMTENVEEQEMLVESQPAIYYLTPHYEGWPAVLARLARLSVAEARLRLERAWRKQAPKTLVRQLDAGAAAVPVAKAAKPKRAAAKGKPARPAKPLPRAARKR